MNGFTIHSTPVVAVSVVTFNSMHCHQFKKEYDDDGECLYYFYQKYGESGKVSDFYLCLYVCPKRNSHLLPPRIHRVVVANHCSTRLLLLSVYSFASVIFSLQILIVRASVYFPLCRQAFPS